MKRLIDPHGRHIHKLRLSLLDACNLRCLYCMPENSQFMPASHLLRRQEIFHISSTLNELGIDEIRLTGGEPSMRKDFMSIVEDLSELKLKKLCLTSNGIGLKKNLPELKNTKCKYINFSLDSLNEKGFELMTRRKGLESVLESIFTAQEYGFKVKVNAVLMKGLNDREIFDFVQFSAKHKIEVRFLELMRIGTARDEFEKRFISAEECINLFKEKWDLKPDERPVDSTSFNYIFENGAQIGFIASESKPFCGGCSRLRLSAEGLLRPCLMVNSGISLKEKSKSEIEEILVKTMALKPVDRIYEVAQDMNQIGG